MRVRYIIVILRLPCWADSERCKGEVESASGTVVVLYILLRYISEVGREFIFATITKTKIYAIFFWQFYNMYHTFLF